MRSTVAALDSVFGHVLRPRSRDNPQSVAPAAPATVASGLFPLEGSGPARMQHELSEQGDMENRLIEYWRNRPEDLRRAVRDAREAFQRSPKAARRLPAGDYLVGESTSGAVVFGVVITDQCSASELEPVLNAAAAFIEANRADLQAARKAGRKTRQLVRLEVFLPPYFAPDMPPSIEGVPVECFRWVPVSEHQVFVEKLAAVSEGRAAGDSVIARLLAHLTWLAEVAKTAPKKKPPIGWAFRVYNAAVQLQLHAIASSEVRAGLDRVPDQKFTKALAKLIEFGAHATEPLRTPEGLAAANETMIRRADRDDLVNALDRVVEHAIKAGRVLDVSAERHREFETAPDVPGLLRQLRNGGRGSAAALEAANAALEGEPELADLCRALAGFIAARSPIDTGAVRLPARAAAQDMAVRFLGVAAGNLPKRHRRLGEMIGNLLDAHAG